MASPAADTVTAVWNMTSAVRGFIATGFQPSRKLTFVLPVDFAGPVLHSFLFKTKVKVFKHRTL